MVHTTLQPRHLVGDGGTLVSTVLRPETAKEIHDAHYLLVNSVGDRYDSGTNRPARSCWVVEGMGRHLVDETDEQASRSAVLLRHVKEIALYQLQPRLDLGLELWLELWLRSRPRMGLELGPRLELESRLQLLQCTICCSTRCSVLVSDGGCHAGGYAGRHGQGEKGKLSKRQPQSNSTKKKALSKAIN
jgi:hypothetical protein